MAEDAEFCSCMDPQCASGKRHPDRDSSPVLTKEQWASRFLDEALSELRRENNQMRARYGLEVSNGD